MQSADLTQMTDKTAPRVTITHHPDVRRSLMLQKAYAEGLRAVYLYTATFQDQIQALADESAAAEPQESLAAGIKILSLRPGIASARDDGDWVEGLVGIPKRVKCKLIPQHRRTVGKLDGQVFVLFVIVVAAAEAAVGLGIIILIARNRQSLNVERVNLLKL